MKEQLITLQDILGDMGYEYFYICSITPYDVRLQGNFNPTLVLKLKNLGYLQSISDNGYLQFDTTGVCITLTN